MMNRQARPRARESEGRKIYVLRLADFATLLRAEGRAPRIRYRFVLFSMKILQAPATGGKPRRRAWNFRHESRDRGHTFRRL
jgi:hypothetical protein